MEEVEKMAGPEEIVKALEDAEAAKRLFLAFALCDRCGRVTVLLYSPIVPVYRFIHDDGLRLINKALSRDSFVKLLQEKAKDIYHIEVL